MNKNQSCSFTNVLILGAGIAGLSTAHHLVKNQFQNILLIEKESSIGGLAKSSMHTSNIHTEHCWRIIGSNYKNFLQIMKDLNCLDKLIPIHHSLIPSISCGFQNISMQDLFDPQLKKWYSVFKTLFGPYEILKRVQTLKKIFQIIQKFAKTKQLPSYTRNITWLKLIDPKDEFTTRQKRRLAYIWAPLLGVDPQKVSASTILEVIFDMIQAFEKEKNLGIYVFSGPSQIVFFNPWKTFLENQGVKFQLETKVLHVEVSQHSLHKVWTSKGLYVCKYLVSALPIHHLIQVFPNIPQSLCLLSKLSKQCQIGLQLYFRERLMIQPKKSVYVLADSPWQLVIEPVREFWTDFKESSFCKDEWSIGLCDPYTLGLVIKKSWMDCKIQEVIQEVWTQICSHDFSNTVYGKKSVKKWKEFSLIGGHFKNTMKVDPKTSPNAGTYWLRPHSPLTGVSTFVLAGDYVLANANSPESREIIRMEAACTSGKVAALALINGLSTF